MFETSGILNEESLRKIKKFLVPPKHKIFTIIFAFVCALLSIVSVFYIKDIILFVYSVCLTLIIICGYFYFMDAFYKKTFAMIKENSNKDEIQYKISFNETGASVNNLTNGGKTTINYNAFIRLEDTEDMFLLFTKVGQYIMVFKDCLDSKEIDEFKVFIKEKCINIK